MCILSNSSSGDSFHMINPDCHVIHGLIQIGNCPRCSSFIIDGEIDQDRPRNSGTARWNISSFVHSFDIQSKGFLLLAMRGILLQANSSKLESFLPIIRKALTHLDPDIRLYAAQILKTRSCILLSREAELLEMKLQSNPDDLASRIVLLCYYYFMKERAPSCATLHYKHVFWIIENNPCLVSSTDIGPFVRLDSKTDDCEIYQQAKELWVKQIQFNKNHFAFLVSFAEFFAHQEPSLSEAFYKEAIKLEPNNIRVRKKFAHLHEMAINNSDDDFKRKEQAKKALAEYEVCFELLTNHQRERLRLLPELAESAFEAGEWKKACNYAEKLLQRAVLSGDSMQEDGEAIHYGHIVLGRLALKQEDRVKAKWHLLQAGRSKGSLLLQFGGPNMKLARDLLKLGERDVVIRYLMSCTFWYSFDNKLQKWIDTIEHGGIPDLGPICEITEGQGKENRENENRNENRERKTGTENRENRNRENRDIPRLFGSPIAKRAFWLLVSLFFTMCA